MSTDRRQWKKSVEHARLANTKSFQGHMEAAKASLVAVPKNGKNAQGTLAQFAEEAGIGYASLDYYRQTWNWLHEDFRYVSEIGSYSLAVEAMKAGEWKSAKAFTAMMRKNPTPTLRLAGYEPYTFASWTRDALRVYLGQRPTATTLLAMEAIETGTDPEPERRDAAALQDDYDDVMRRMAEAGSEPHAYAEAPSKSPFQKFTDLSFGLWALQDELRDTVLSPDERERMRTIARATRQFLDAVEAYLETGNFDEDVARLLAEVQK